MIRTARKVGLTSAPQGEPGQAARLAERLLWSVAGVGVAAVPLFLLAWPALGWAAVIAALVLYGPAMALWHVARRGTCNVRVSTLCGWAPCWRVAGHRGEHRS